MPRNDEKDLDLKWSGRWMLLHRILAVNIFALAVLAGSIFYLDSFRGRLTAGAVTGAEAQVGIMADSLALAEPGEETALLHRLGDRSRTRLRVFQH
ncbi:MAG: sensor N-terminal transmembrane domain-containing protein, partial [Allosphingosinicella sp.]